MSKKREGVDGCSQFVYCNECMAYPMGFGCPKKRRIASGSVNDQNEFLGDDGSSSYFKKG